MGSKRLLKPRGWSIIGKGLDQKGQHTPHQAHLYIDFEFVLTASTHEILVTSTMGPHLVLENKKKIGPFLDLCVSFLCRGHANFLCIVLILSDVPEGTNLCFYKVLYIGCVNCSPRQCGILV